MEQAAVPGNDAEREDCGFACFATESLRPESAGRAGRTFWRGSATETSRLECGGGSRNSGWPSVKSSSWIVVSLWYCFLGAAVQCDEFLVLDLEFGDEEFSVFSITIHAEDFSVLEDGEIEVDGFLSVVVEPEEWGDLLHGVND